MATIATAEVEIIADTSRFLGDLRRKLASEFTSFGDDLGNQIASRIQASINRSLGRVRIPASAANKSGATYGKQFDTGFRSAVKDMFRFGNIFLGESLETGIRWGTGFVASARTAFRRIDDALNNSISVGARLGLQWGRQFVSSASSSLRSIGRSLKESLGYGSKEGRQWGSGFVQSARTALSRIDQVVSRAVDRSKGIQAGIQFGKAFVRAASIALRSLRRSADGPGYVDGVRAGRQWGRGFSTGAGRGLQAVAKPLRSLASGPMKAFSSLFSEVPSNIGNVVAAGTALYGVFVQLAPLAAAIPAAIGLIGSAAATAILAFRGFGDVFSGLRSGNLDDVRKAMEDLTPSARSAVEEMIQVRDAFTGLSDVAQESVFAEINGHIEQLGKTLAGPLKEGLSQAGTGLGQFISKFLDFSGSDATGDAITATFSSLGNVFKTLSSAVEPFFSGLRDVAVAILPKFEEFSGSLAEAGSRFGEFLSQGAESGSIAAGFDTAVGVLETLWDLASELGRLFRGIFDSAEESGSGFIGTLSGMVTLLADVANSAEGQEALGQVFRSMSVIFNALAPVVGAFVTGIGQIAPIFANLASIAGPALESVIGFLADGLSALGGGSADVFRGLAEAVEAAAPSLTILGEGISAVFTAISPLLPALGQIAGLLIQLVGGALSALAPAIEPIATAIAILVDALVGPASDAISAFFNAISPVVELLGTTFADVITDLTPTITELVGVFSGTFSKVLSDIVPLLTPIITTLGTGLGEIFEKLSPLIMELVTAFSNALIPVLNAILPVIGPILDIFLELIGSVLQIMIPIWITLAEVIEQLAPLFTDLFDLLTPVLEIFKALLPPVTDLITGLLDGILPILPALIGLFVQLLEIAIDPLTTILNVLVKIIQKFLVPILNTTIDVITVITSVIGGLVTIIIDIASTISNVLGAAFDWIIEKIVGPVTDTFTSIGDTISGFSDDIGEIADDILEWINNIVDWFKDLPGRVLDGLKNLGSDILDAITPDWDLSSILPFADGGVVNGPTFAMIGEAGPEVVIPLSKPQRALALAQQSGLMSLIANNIETSPSPVSRQGDININMHSNSVDPDVVARRTARALYRSMVVG